MKDIFAKLITSFPIDSTAAKVSGCGTSFVPSKIVLTNDSDFPIATREINKSEKSQQCFKCGANWHESRAN